MGSSTTSWGWCLKSLKVYHDSRKYRNGVPYPRDIDEKLKVPNSFYMILDMDRGTLAFQVTITLPCLDRNMPPTQLVTSSFLD